MLQHANLNNDLVGDLKVLRCETPQKTPQEIYRWAKANVPAHRDPVVDDYLKELCPWWGRSFEDWVEAASKAPGVIELNELRILFRDGASYKNIPGVSWAIGLDDRYKDKKPFRLSIYSEVYMLSGGFDWVPGCAVWFQCFGGWETYAPAPNFWERIPSPLALEEMALLDAATEHQLSYDLMHDSQEESVKLGKALWAEVTHG